MSKIFDHQKELQLIDRAKAASLKLKMIRVISGLSIAAVCLVGFTLLGAFLLAYLVLGFTFVVGFVGGFVISGKLSKLGKNFRRTKGSI